MSITDAENVTTKIPYINEELQYHHTVAYKCRSFQKTFHEKKKKKKAICLSQSSFFLFQEDKLEIWRN